MALLANLGVTQARRRREKALASGLFETSGGFGRDPSRPGGPNTGPGQSKFDIATLFENGEQGAWYDPNDFSSLYQDSIGATPVTALEQPVGLMLDKRLGLERGPELAPQTVAEWQLYATPTISGNDIICSSGGMGLRLPGLVVGQTYELISSGSATVGFTWQQESGSTVYRGGHGRCIFTAVYPILILRASAAGTITLDSVSLRQVGQGPANHATQATADSRPVLSARKNMLVKTEDMNDLVWTHTNSGVAAIPNVTPGEIAPDGTATAFRVRLGLNGGVSTNDFSRSRQTVNGLSTSIKYVHSVYVKSYDNNTYTAQLIKPDGSGQAITITPEWQRLEVSSIGAGTGSSQQGIMVRGGQTPTHSNSIDIVCWHHQFEIGEVATRYQRVNTLTDYDSENFPIGLRFDGSNDSMMTSPINFSVTDKLTVIHATAKHASFVVSVLFELGTSGAVGGFNSRLNELVTNDRAAVHMLGSGGPISYTYTETPSPGPYVHSYVLDIAGSTLLEEIPVARQNGVQMSKGGGPTGVGNFLNEVLYLGRRQNGSGHFKGMLFGAVIRGAASNDEQIEAVEEILAEASGLELAA